MANEDAKLSVEGIESTKAALKKVQDFDIAAANQEAAMRLIGPLRRFTRVRTGALSRGWDANSGSIVNVVPWAIPQEYGSKYVDPMNAVESAWSTSEKTVIEAYEDAINKTIET